MTETPIPQDRFHLFTRNLLKWYRTHGRDLPWRRTSDPYAVWISEIMLQQTQVATVLPYYDRFLLNFPTVLDLATAPLDQVLKMWEGLGYYARARHLHRAAGEVVARFGGLFPSRFEEILSLPGIGRSTAGAIATIAFGRRYPILDGNVKRVLCRYFCIEDDPKKKAVEERLWNFAERLLPKEGTKEGTGEYTQAIMDLGATLCSPVAPGCTVCPVKKGCEAFATGIQESLPVREKGKTIPKRDYVAGLLLYNERVLIRRRPEKGLWGGLWEFPGGRVDPNREEKGFAGRMRGILKKEIPWPVERWTPLGGITHTLTHFKMTLHLFSGEIEKGGGEDRSDLRWVPIKKLADYPFSSAHQKVFAKLRGCEEILGPSWVAEV
ncbi:MAG: A/G-specific adenine glycosylase [Candidatus Manganitrophaceae bacterium]